PPSFLSVGPTEQFHRYTASRPPYCCSVPPRSFPLPQPHSKILDLRTLLPESSHVQRRCETKNPQPARITRSRSRARIPSTDRLRSRSKATRGRQPRDL